MPIAPASIKRALIRAIGPRACALAGACAGLLVGWFGLAVGSIIGAMLDAARLEARARSIASAFFSAPGSCAPPEPLEGYAAAACLALRGEWPGLADRSERRSLFDRLSGAILPPGARARREAERLADVATRCLRPDLPGLARGLATSEADPARRLLAEWAFALAAIGRTRLGPEEELGLRASLGDCGLGPQEIFAARLKAFPGTRDPWTVLGLQPGAPLSETKRAYRRLSRLLHPDAIPGDDGERFRELCAAYSELTARPIA
jgi:hypothetical protein